MKGDATEDDKKNKALSKTDQKSSRPDSKSSSKPDSEKSESRDSNYDTITLSDEEESTRREPGKLDLTVEPAQIERSNFKSVRDFFGEDEAVYIMDAKTNGNIGRYLNVSDMTNCEIIYNSFLSHLFNCTRKIIIILSAFLRPERFCAERLRGHSRRSISLGGFLRSSIYKSRSRIDLELQLRRGQHPRKNNYLQMRSFELQGSSSISSIQYELNAIKNCQESRVNFRNIVTTIN